MRKVGSLAVCAVVGLALASPASPDKRSVDPPRAGSTGQRLEAPDGLLVLAVLAPERAMVADPRTGATTVRRLAGGTLCHGPLLAVGERVILSGLRGRRVVALSLPLTLKGRPRPLGDADTSTRSDTPGRRWPGSWTSVDAEASRHFRVRSLDLPEGLRPQPGAGQPSPPTAVAWRCRCPPAAARASA